MVNQSLVSIFRSIDVKRTCEGDEKKIQNMMTKKILLLPLLFLLIVDVLSADGETYSTRKKKFTRSSTAPTTTIEETTTTTVVDEGLDEKKTDSNEQIEKSVVTADPPSPSILVDIVTTKKSLRVRNCGERIGDDVPFIALLVHTNPLDSSTKKRTLSKGVLVSENFVLTTVSSIYHSESFWTVSSIRLGDFITWNKYASRDKSYSLEIGVEQIYFHKKRDIALIKLKESVNFSDTIQPACLPLSDNYNFKELRTHLCKRSNHPKTLADVSLEFASPLTTFDCRKFFSRKQISISPHEFCVWDDETRDDCAGDLATSLFTIHNGRFFLVGLKSYAETNDEDDDIDPTEYPGIYIKIGSYLDWISAVINLDASNKTATTTTSSPPSSS